MLLFGEPLEQKPEHEEYNDKQSKEISKIRYEYNKLTDGNTVPKKVFITEIIRKALGLTSSKTQYQRYKMLLDGGYIQEIAGSVSFIN
jgi:predicted nuclease with TOPRIM domain